MKIRILHLCLICVVVSVSCQKEDYLDTANTESLLLSQIIVDKAPSFEYTYNSSNLINEEKSKFAFNVNHYNEKNQLVTTDYYTNFDILSNDPEVFETAMNQKYFVAATKSNLSGTINYEYSANDQLIKTIYTPALGNKQTSQFSYDGDERINKQVLYWDNNQVGYMEYSYDADGNLTEETLYSISISGGMELSASTVYEYDTKQNPFRRISRLPIPGINTNNNNITRETQTIHINAAQGGDVVETTTNSYKYNLYGYPIGRNGNVEYLYQ